MLPIYQIDMSQTINAFNFSTEDAKNLSAYVLDRITDSYMQKWEEIVDKNLKKSASSYKAGMDAKRLDDYTQVFLLEGKGDGKLGLMIEMGHEAFDEKPGFLNSPKRKAKKSGNGYYLTIPFRVATAEAIAASPIFASKQTQELQKIAKNLKQGEYLNKNNVPKELQNYGIREEMSNYPEYKHKSFDYEGLRHSTKENHGQYEMFRRVSDESDPDSWIHPGFEAKNFMEKALQEIQIEKIYAEARDEFLAQRD